MLVRLALMDASKTLRDAGLTGGERDARLIFAFVDGSPVGRLSLKLDHVTGWTDGQRAAFDDMIALRATGVPVAKIIGTKSFWKGEFAVNFHVLDPRPETETLVELALQHPFQRVLDLGTGSGCILVSLLSERRGATGVGVDISNDALDVARRNAALNGADEAAEFHTSDWFSEVTGTFDLIVSNPPYISAAEMNDISHQVRDFEPRVALTDGADGLTAYGQITARVMDFLDPGGRLLVEIGPTQGDAVARMFENAGLGGVTVHPDLDGRPRVVAGRKPAPGAAPAH